MIFYFAKRMKERKSKKGKEKIVSKICGINFKKKKKTFLNIRFKVKIKKLKKREKKRDFTRKKETIFTRIKLIMLVKQKERKISLLQTIERIKS